MKATALYSRLVPSPLLLPGGSLSLSPPTTPGFLRYRTNALAAVLTAFLLGIVIACLPAGSLYLPASPIPGSATPSSSKGSLPSAGESFPDYLARATRGRENDLLWLTLADSFYATTATAHLEHSLARLSPVPGSAPSSTTSRISSFFRGNGKRSHNLVVLCLDEGCMQTCKEKRWSCFDGYRFDKPEIMLEATWPKLQGIIETLASGRDVMFIDSDVFLKGNPFLSMPTLGSYDIQIQDEALRGEVNTGFMHIVPNERTLAHFQKVLSLDLESVSRDQARTNALLGTRDSLAQRHFTSPTGLEINVVPPEVVYAYHLELERKEVSRMDAVALHGTCLDNAAYKHLIARDLGFWQDVNSYYSRPPKALVLPSLAGTPERIAHQLETFIAIGLGTNRSVIPPTHVSIVLDDGSLMTRQFSSTFDLYNLYFELKLPLLEPKYIAHALPHHITSATAGSAFLTAHELSVQPYRSFEDLVGRLSLPDVEDKLVVTLTDWDLVEYQVPEGDLLPGNLRLCKELHLPPTCGQICRR